MKPSELPLLVKIVLLAAPIPIGLLLAFSGFEISKINNKFIQGAFILVHVLVMLSLLKFIFGKSKK